VELYRDAARQAGHDPAKMLVGINSHGFIGDDSRETAAVAWPPYASAMGRIGKERGWPPPTREGYDAQRAPHGALLIGDPEEVTEKILYEHELFRMERFLFQLSVGGMQHERVMRAIELFGTKVAPAVRKAVLPAR
jgi:alkanesulfonate monooxygenase SsuD/methylene tetrahydromethanopterin reductase-like flavin-dependent oxidoreductase (luciferase family)